ncbi:porin [Bradyrhizobium oligotrophicum]|uniref:porin n=1 Tax=Bradyrhizobium oligotrophicum TaxID=44255 RepID=UPI003EB8EFE1
MLRSIALGALASLVLVTIASAGSPGESLLSPKAATTSRPGPRPGAATANPCAAYGANFRRIEGTDTCIKVGGAVGVATGGSIGR